MITAEIKPRVLAYLLRIQAETANGTEAHYMLSDIIDDISSARVAITMEKSSEAPSLPQYDAATDGPYEAWLVANNMD